MDKQKIHYCFTLQQNPTSGNLVRTLTRLPTPSSMPHLNWNLPFSSISVRKLN
ncbi:MAG: hypothetical protein ACI4TD_13510 [Phocaeicola sp.]